ncbi:MAG: pyridoxamine 5'-phosphate oxidase family protein [Desulfobacterales bacterium]
MDDFGSIRRELKKLLTEQGLGVLSTHGEGQPYASLVAFAAASDLGELLFATPAATRKYANLVADGRVALLINNCVNSVEDFHGATAVTALGDASVLAGDTRRAHLELYLSRHPYLREFALSSTTALIRITVNRYILVKEFQKVVEVNPPFTLEQIP